MTTNFKRYLRAASKKLGLLIMMLLLVSISHVGFCATGKIDTAKMISTYKADSAKAQTKIDSLEKKIKAADTAKPAVFYENGFLISISIIGLICVVICGFLIYTSNNCPKDGKYALGLPDGTVRALIALFTIVFYILISLAFSLFSKDSTIATDVIKTLGTLVVAVSSFYFGSKTAEQSGKNLAENLKTAMGK